MKKLVRRIATAAASATLAGSALIAVGSPASAAALPADQQGRPGAVVHVSAERSDQSLAGPAEIGEGRALWDGYRDWHSARDHRGYAYWQSSDHGRQLRYDGQRVYHLIDGRWAVVIPADEHTYGFDRWHFDQLWSLHSAENQRSI
ncbi:hypothetical protein [Streptomyces sp. NPDC002133]|uniref:hypothetical protein n=1 Tax=Streptomyces sp. NPDC002133 TaxID=3154409 RepID=UPI0033275C98